MPTPLSHIMHYATKLGFSNNLQEVLVTLAKTCNITISFIPDINIANPLNQRGDLWIEIICPDMDWKSQRFVVKVDDKQSIDEIHDMFDTVAKDIFNVFPYLGASPHICKAGSSETLNTVIDKLKNELLERGNFEIDIPKFIDVLFKLGVIKAKED